MTWWVLGSRKLSPLEGGNYAFWLDCQKHGSGAQVNLEWRMPDGEG